MKHIQIALGGRYAIPFQKQSSLSLRACALPEGSVSKCDPTRMASISFWFPSKPAKSGGGGSRKATPVFFTASVFASPACEARRPQLSDWSHLAERLPTSRDFDTERLQGPKGQALRAHLKQGPL